MIAVTYSLVELTPTRWGHTCVENTRSGLWARL